MDHPENTSIHYEWEIVRSSTEEEFVCAGTSGTDSEETLSLLFAVWLRDRGDVSGWADRAAFGVLVDEYSTLHRDEIAVWLCFEDGLHLYRSSLGLDFESSLPYEFEGPQGYTLTIRRKTR